MSANDRLVMAKRKTTQRKMGRMEGRCQFLRISFEYMSDSHEGECYIHTPLEQVLEESFTYSIKLMEEKFKKRNIGLLQRVFNKKYARNTSPEEVFTKEEMDNKRMEILWTDTSTVHVTIVFAQRSPWNKEWFQKFIFGFYRSNILRVNERESPSR